MRLKTPKSLWGGGRGGSNLLSSPNGAKLINPPITLAKFPPTATLKSGSPLPPVAASHGNTHPPCSGSSLAPGTCAQYVRATTGSTSIRLVPVSAMAGLACGLDTTGPSPTEKEALSNCQKPREASTGAYWMSPWYWDLSRWPNS